MNVDWLGAPKLHCIIIGLLQPLSG